MLHVQRIDQIHCEGNNVVSKCSRDKILTFLIIQTNKSLGRGFFPFGQQGPPLTVAKDLKKKKKKGCQPIGKVAKKIAPSQTGTNVLVGLNR